MKIQIKFVLITYIINYFNFHINIQNYRYKNTSQNKYSTYLPICNQWILNIF